MNPSPLTWALVIVAAVMTVAFVIVSTRDLYRHSDRYKRKHGLCWMFDCFEKVTDCKAGREHNGPMCPAHCAKTRYHTWFAGCGTADGIPLRDKGIEGTIEALRRGSIFMPIDRRKP